MTNQEEMIFLHNVLRYINGKEKTILFSDICQRFNINEDDLDRLFVTHFEGNHGENILNNVKSHKRTINQCECVKTFYLKMREMGINLSAPNSTSETVNQEINIKDIIKYINGLPLNQINVIDIANKYQCTSADLDELFYRVNGMLFDDYLNRLRLERCIEMLQIDNVSSEIASGFCGFKNFKEFNSLYFSYYPQGNKLIKDDALVSISEEEQYFICNIIQYIHQSYDDVDINAIATYFKMPRKDLEKKFYLLSEISLSQYINQIRVENILLKIKVINVDDLMALLNKYGFQYASDFLVSFYLIYNYSFSSYITEQECNISADSLAYVISEANIEMLRIIDYILTYIDSSEKFLDLNALARRVNLDSDVIIAIFKLCQVPNLKFNIENQNVRLFHEVSMSGMPISEASAKLGFKNVRDYSASFEKCMKLSPNEYAQKG